MVYDVIVIGAGPAGSIAAYRCANAGLNTLLLEKAKFPRVKPCGGAVSVRSLTALAHVGLQVPSSVIEQKIFGFHLMGPEMKPFEYRSNRLLAYTVQRAKFDNYLANQATKAGAEFIQDCALTGLEQHQNYVRCETEKGSFEGQLVIGADGATSTVGRLVELRQARKPNEIGIAVEVDVPIAANLWSKGLDPSLLLMWFLNIPDGYFWVFPRRHSLSLGVGGIAGKLGNVPRLLRGLSNMFCEQYDLPPLNLQKFRGHLLPVFESLIPLTAHRVLLVGDAAGFIDAFSGQGICYALESGIIGAQTAFRIIKQSQNLSTASLQYRTQILQRFGEELRCSWSVMRHIHAHSYGVFRVARLWKWPGQIICALARGNTDYYRLWRNPLRLIFFLLISELQLRLGQSF
ncbi:MAG: NAD(P)/FAD-dependent oxidoreductase [Candidatus Thorarchaeota archaeon]